MHFEIDEDGTRRLYEQIGRQVQQIVNDTFAETVDTDLDSAVETLHERLNRVEGLEFDRAWSRNAMETLRGGNALTIELQ